MAKSVKLRRGTTEEHNLFVGEDGEITVDTGRKTVVVHYGGSSYPLLNAKENSVITSPTLIAEKILFKNQYASVAALPNAVTYPGMIASVLNSVTPSENKAYYSNGTTWVPLTQGTDLTGFVSGAANTGNVGDQPVFLDKSGTNLRFRSLRGGNNVSITRDDAANALVITSASYTGANVGGGAGVFKEVTGTEFDFKSISAGAGIGVVEYTDDITITADIQDAFNTVTVGATNIAASGNDTLAFSAGSGISLTGNAGTKTVSVAVNLTATNDGTQTGSGVLSSYSAGVFSFNKIQAGTGIQLTAGANGEIVVSAPQIGTVTGAANLSPPSPTSLGLYKQDDAGVLKFYNISAGSNITITYSDANNLQISAATGGSAGVGTVQSGTAGRLAFYPSTGTAVGPTDSTIYVNTVTNKIVANIEGEVSTIANHTTSGLPEGTNLYYTQTRFDTALSGKTTDSLAEGATNYYFTNDRAQDAASTMMLAGNPAVTRVTQTTTAPSTSIGTITVGNTSGIAIGYVVTGTTVPVGVTVTVQQVLSGTQFTVSPAVFAISGTTFLITDPVTSGTLTISATATATSTADITVGNTAGITSGQVVSGTGVTGTSAVTSVPSGTVVRVSPGYNVAVPFATSLQFTTLTSNGLNGAYDDNAGTFAYTLDSNFIGQRARQAITVATGQGLVYDNVSGTLSLSGAVTQVNGQTGTVILAVGDIAGAAPLASPTFTGTPRAPDIISGDNNFKIANKKYVDDNITSIRGTPGAGLGTIQALGAAINNDTQFFVTVNTALDTKLPRAGGTITGVLLLNTPVDFATSDPKTAATKLYVDQRATVQTVNTLSGNVVLTTNFIAETTPTANNLWFTQARARASISALLDNTITDLLSYNTSDGIIRFNPVQVRNTVDVQQDNSISSLLTYASGDGIIRFKPNTDVLTEGTSNLFYTDTRVRSSLSIASNSSQANLFAYNSTSGQFTYNASTDKVSEGTNNLYFTNTRSRSSISLSTNNPTQTSFLTYNTASGQFALNSTTTYITEGTNLYYTDARARGSIAVAITQSNTVNASNSLVYNNASGVLTFNANTNSLVEGDGNLFFTQARARQAVSLTTSDSSVLTYDNSTGVFTFAKQNTDKTAEGVTNLYFTQSRARTSISAVVTTTSAQASGNSLLYDNTTGVLTFNANTDNIVEGATNKYFSNTLARNAVSLTLTTTAGVATFASYTTATGVLAINSNTDSITEGTTNFWASSSRVRGYLSVASNFDGVISYNSSTGVFTPQISVNTTNLVYTPTADGTTAKTFNTVQDIATSSSPKFVKVSTTSANAPGTPLTLTSGVANCNMNLGNFFEFNRNANMTDIAFSNVPASGNYVEVTISLVNVSGGVFNFTTGTDKKWAGSTKPNLSSTSTAAGVRDIFKFFTYDGGTTWYEISRAIAVA